MEQVSNYINGVFRLCSLGFSCSTRLWLCWSRREMQEWCWDGAELGQGWNRAELRDWHKF